MIVALDVPSPKTVCVAFFHKSQAVHTLAAFRSTGIVPRGGAKPAAVSLAAFGLFSEILDAGFIALTRAEWRRRFNHLANFFSQRG